ncbi:MAG: alpha-2-macroglobulin family protein [Cytophaga sp.]|uniref:alpha-2-macroglobulin family protein n=1 Tax=Cytophaga sp. TaxID=29535 RepID=UPI003F7F2F57
MLRFLIPFLLLFVSVFSFAQQTKIKATKPPYRYIYAVTRAQAWKIHSGQYKEVYTKDFLSKPIDSLTVFDQVPGKYETGRYILLSPEEKFVRARFISSDAHTSYIIETPGELGVAVKNVTHQSLQDLQFYNGETKIQLQHNGYYYVIPRELYNKRLMIEYKEELFFVEVPRTVDKTKYSKKLYESKGEEGFILTDKSKYHIGDTVFMKGYFSWSLLPKKTKIELGYNKNYRFTTVFEKKIKKDAYGSYITYFVLPDTLPVDQQYRIYMDQKSRSRITYFDIEDYKLDDFLLDADIDFDEKYQDSLTVTVQCKTPQGDPLNGGYIYLNIEPTSVRLTGPEEMYVPYWKIRDSIQTDGHTAYIYKTKMPGLPYGKYEMNLTVQVSNNGLTEEIKQEFDYSYRPVVMTHVLKGHVIEFNPYATSVSPTTGFAIYGRGYYEKDTLPVSFPYAVDLQYQKMPRAFLVGQTHIEVDIEGVESDPLDFTYTVQQNAINVQIHNPFKLPLSVKNEASKFLFRKDDAELAFKIPLEKNQMLYCEYLFQGEYFQKRLLISPDYQSLIIDAALPDTIQPGEAVQGNVHVRDINNKPLSGVNLTALAVDSRLGHEEIPGPQELISYDYDMFANEYAESGRQISTTTGDTLILKNVYDAYYRFLHKDSVNYFLIPEPADSMTEAFIYVQKRDISIRPGYVFEDDKPVYWSDNGGTSVQSFYTTPGYHSYEIRLPDETIYMDSIFVYGGFKNNILIPIDRIAKNKFRRQSRPKRLTEEEIETLNPYLYFIKGKYEFDLVTKTNFYSGIRSIKNIINADKDLHVIADPGDTVIVYSADSAFNKTEYDYLKRQRFVNLSKYQAGIDMTELQALERPVYLLQNEPCDFYNSTVGLSKPEMYADLYVRYYFKYETIIKLFNDRGVIAVDSNRSSYYTYVDFSKFNIAAAGAYTLQFFNAKGELINEHAVQIDGTGNYFTEIISDVCTQQIKEKTAADLYSNETLRYPPATMLYRSKYSDSYYSRRRRRYARDIYWSVYGGFNIMDTKSQGLNTGYQFGAAIGKQLSGNLRGELRFSYGETALSASQPYQYPYAKIGLMGWYSLVKGYDFSLSLGSGISGQQRLDVSGKNRAASIPVGAALKYYQIPYTESVGLEVLWNKAITGTDYSYLNQGVWEVNLRVNFTLHGRARVCCPSSFWGAGDDVGVYNYSPAYKWDKDSPGYLGNDYQGISHGLTNSDAYEEVAVVGRYSKRMIGQADSTAAVETFENVTYEQVRSNFYDRAYWVPSFTTDKNGNATFRANYPDALTHWDNYILAYNKKRQLNVRFIQNTTYLNNYVQLYVPRFVIAGDSASASYHVQSDKPFTVKNSVDNTAAGESIAVDGHYSFYVPEQADTVSCKSVLLVDDKQADGEQRLIPVYRAGNDIYTGMYKYLVGDTLLDITKADTVLETRIYISNSLQDLARIQYQQLMDYKYACNEQTASKLIGAIAGMQLNGSYGGKNPQRFYSKLKSNINDDYLYGWWGAGRTSLSISAYALYAMQQYYKSIGIDYENIYVSMEKRLRESAAYNKVDYFTYWLMEESKLSMDGILLKSAEPANYKDEILQLRIRQLQGDTITRNEIEKYVEKTILDNKALNAAAQFEAAWYDHEALYLVILHRIAKNDFPDLAAQIRKGLVEKGCLSEYTPTYVKALFIQEFTDFNAVQKNTAVVSFDNTVVSAFPYTKTIQNNTSHTIKIDEAAGIYVVKSDRQIRTTAMKHDGLDIEYFFQQDGQKITALQSGTVVEQVVQLNVAANCSYVMVEIPIAAGCTLEDVITSNPDLLSHSETFRDKIILYFTDLPEGSYTFRLRQKVLFKGHYQLNPCSVNLMYFPMIQTQTAVRRMKVN